MLTPRQSAILAYLESQHAAQGMFPTLREIQQHFGFASPFAVTRHLQALVKKGALQRPGGKARCFILPQAHADKKSGRIPLFGTIPAGRPVDAEMEADRFIAIEPGTLGLPRQAAVFALSVRGDSMTGAGILEGDVVFLTPREPRDRDIVAALIDGESTLKRFVREDGRAVLHAENPRYPALFPANELVIQGVMVGLLRTKT